MADFLETRDELRQQREAHDQLQLAASASSYRLKNLERELAGLQRQKGDNNPVYLKKAGDLEHRIGIAKEQAATAHNQFSAARDKLAQAEKSFDLFIDPRIQLQDHFSNGIPFLLFPLRMETRFKIINNQAQLWVRVYPDECLVDSFEPLLSKKEVNNAARFWAEYYGAGKPADVSNPEPAIVDLQKAAWRLIVSAHGSGRAAWITRQLVPDEATSIFPVRGAKTVILAIATDSWNPANQDSLTGFFTQLWLANGNDVLVKKAKEDFAAANLGMEPDDIIARYQPVNFDEPLPAGLKREEADLKFAIAVFPDLEKISGKEHSWSLPSRVNILPERLALIRFKKGLPMEPVFGNTIPSPLPTSPDPSADADKQFEQTPDGDLVFADVIKWVADFDRAVQIGMGFRLNLAPDELDGFERLMVLGVRIGADESEGKKQLETLFDHHFFTKKGLQLLPQGTPTNNTEAAGSGFTWKENADDTFEPYFNKKDGFKHESKREQKADGQWLAEWLGIDERIFTKVLNSGGRDQGDAINMNIALWPATMGYMLGSLMHFAIEPETVDMARDFFNNNVRGRGSIPAVRIGNQPYGILPTTAFKRLQWMNAGDNAAGAVIVKNETSNFTKDLYRLLLRIDEYWNEHFLPSVSHIAQPSADVYKTLLDILSLHPTSAEFHRRYLESLIEISNTVSIVKPAFHLHKDVVTDAMYLMRNTFDYSGDAIPQIAALLAHAKAYPVTHLIDDVPLSETSGIGDYTADHKNYIAALAREARKSEDAVRTGEGLTRHPGAELYRLLKFALELGYHASSVNAVASEKVFDETRISAMRAEQPFIHQEFQNTVTESRYSLLYKTIPQISSTKTVSEFIRDSLFEVNIPFFSSYLSAQLKALDALENVPTARLERAFTEHLDCCSYRLDAWKTGIITQELQYMRGNFDDVAKGQSRTGIYLGAFGWLENVHPDKNKTVSTTQLPQDVKDDFDPGNNKVYLTDSSNEGYIHAPSLNQGVTAAVLRNGYISHGKPDGNNVLAVNLSSERIRLALSVIEGIQGGQSLAALLGYHFERTLHDRDDLKEKGIDAYIYPIRKQFPLVAGKLKETSVKNNSDPSVDPDTVPVTAIEARNVVHGVNLANHVKKQTGTNKNYPFGLALVHSDSLINSAITDAVNEIIDIADAVADLGMAESVHHIVMGNVNRAAGVLDSYSKGNYPQAPDVIRTPRSGATLTHRVAVPFAYIDNVPTGGPRAKAEPSVNKWLTNMLPPLNTIVCNCTYTSRADGSQKNIDISLQEIGFEPIDVIYAVHTSGTHALDELDDRLLFHLITSQDPLLGENISLNYTQDAIDPAAVTVFQIMPLIKSLRAVLVESVPLEPTDLALPNEASKKDMPPPELPVKRVDDLKKDLADVLTNAKADAGIIGKLVNLPPTATATDMQLAAIRSKIDTTIDSFATFLLELNIYGIQQTGIGALYTRKQEWYIALKNKVQELVDRWQQKLNDYAGLAALPHDADTLQKMERLVSTSVTPAASITFASVEAKKDLFTNQLDNIKNTIAGKNYAKLADLLQDIQALDIASFDLVTIDIAESLRQIPLFVYDMQARAKTLLSNIEMKRIPAMDKILNAIPALDAVNSAKQIEAAAQIILGNDFKMVPRYALPEDQKAEILSSWSSINVLLDYLMTDKGYANPTEDWLHGIARVHVKMKHLENIILLREAFSMSENGFTIHPVQLPFQTEKYHWLAMPFKGEDIDLEKGNTLLYTAFVDQAAASPFEICGMRVDEWTELIPAKEETTGITFQYNRPNAEAPQTMLLVVPAKLTGNWQWEDLVDSLSYTLEAAKSRAIEPDNQIVTTAFSSFLPAVIGPESLHPYSIVLDNKAHYAVEKTPVIIQ